MELHSSPEGIVVSKWTTYFLTAAKSLFSTNSCSPKREYSMARTAANKTEWLKTLVQQFELGDLFGLLGVFQNCTPAGFRTSADG